MALSTSLNRSQPLWNILIRQMFSGEVIVFLGVLGLKGGGIALFPFPEISSHF